MRKKKVNGILLKSKKAQVMGLSFGTLFSIFLIIFFLAIAFYVIRGFLSTQKSAQIGLFYQDFQDEIKLAWGSDTTDTEFKAKLPSAIEYICFANLSSSITFSRDVIGNNIGIYQGYDANLFLYPKEKAGDMAYKKIKYINLEKITEARNPYCIPVNEGLGKLRIKKGFNEPLVRVSRSE